MAVRFAETSGAAKLRSCVREIEDFPRKGIVCQDVTPILKDPDLFKLLVEEMVTLVKDIECDRILGIDSRGFMFGPPVAKALGAQFSPVFKSSAKVGNVVTEKYQYEYAEDELVLPVDSMQPGTKCLILDDQIVTGGTVVAAIRLVEKLQGKVVGCAFILTQSTYPGVERVDKYGVRALFEKNPSKK